MAGTSAGAKKGWASRKGKGGLSARDKAINAGGSRKSGGAGIKSRAGRRFLQKERAHGTGMQLVTNRKSAKNAWSSNSGGVRTATGTVPRTFHRVSLKLKAAKKGRK